MLHVPESLSFKRSSLSRLRYITTFPSWSIEENLNCLKLEPRFPLFWRVWEKISCYWCQLCRKGIGNPRLAWNLIALIGKISHWFCNRKSLRITCSASLYYTSIWSSAWTEPAADFPFVISSSLKCTVQESLLQRFRIRKQEIFFFIAKDLIEENRRWILDAPNRKKIRVHAIKSNLRVLRNKASNVQWFKQRQLWLQKNESPWIHVCFSSFPVSCRRSLRVSWEAILIRKRGRFIAISHGSNVEWIRESLWESLRLIGWRNSADEKQN